MDFVECVSKFKEMCSQFSICSKCPLHPKAKDYTLCSTYAFKHPEDFVEVVSNWK